LLRKPPRAVPAARLAVLMVAACVTLAAQKVQFNPAHKADILERMENIPGSDSDRAVRIKELFEQAGCSGKLLHEQAVEGVDVPNVICRLQGSESGTVIVGAHYERSTVARPIDDWSGASLLPALFRCLRSKKRRHSYIFIAFADHGQGLTGSKFYADHLSSVEAVQAEAMVNLDPLGLSPTKVWSARSDKDLVHHLLIMVYALKLPASQIDLNASGATDADPFARRGIPPIIIHSLTQQNLRDDAATNFRPDNYYDTYRLLCGYLAYLDEILKPRPN